MSEKPKLTRDIFEREVANIEMQRGRLRNVLRKAGVDFERIPGNNDWRTLAATFGAPYPCTLPELEVRALAWSVNVCPQHLRLGAAADASAPVRGDLNKAPTPETVSASDAAAIAGVTVNTISARCGDGTIASTGKGKNRRVDRADLDKWIAARKAKRLTREVEAAVEEVRQTQATAVTPKAKVWTCTNCEEDYPGINAPTKCGKCGHHTFR